MFCGYLFFSSSVNKIHIGDTIPQNDLVTRQYEALPYPPVTNADIAEEEEFYRNNQQSNPMITSHHLTLENLNHFLFGGNENFR